MTLTTQSHFAPTNGATSKRSSRLRILCCACVVLAVYGCGGGSGSPLTTSTKSFCRDFDKVNQQFADIGADSLLSIADYHQISAALRKLAAEAPGSVKKDLKTMADGADRAAKSGSGFADSAAVRAASDRIASFGDDNCAESES